MTASNLVGTCYEDAWRFLIREEEGELIHGTVESLGRRIEHAWVELPTGFIWEPESRQFIKKVDFEAMAKPQEEARYSVTEAAIMLARVGKHGPWTEEEKRQFLKGNPVGRLEPWQMPKEEFVKVYLDRFKSMLSKEAFARVTAEELEKEREEAIDYQKHTIREALAAGKLVPREVLRDYPESEGSNPDNTWTCPQCGRINQIYPYPTRCSRCGYLRKMEKDFLPMSPRQGPPLPKSLGIRWPWRMGK